MREELTIKDLDPEFQEEFKKEAGFFGKNFSDDSFLKNGILINIATKMICKHKYKHCEEKCNYGKENIFSCKYCGED
jgi:hypothetical protein